ncbi:abnormal spindle-like microcephaly-associated protein homolog isoform X1 [Papaver somniferum]|uniref:abnormal spindle-like microcephaly-associated protein homolog isoform X1 n=1 Tax=Papaver somniferum TaxID=3469 RepID=UPI000E6F710C|nr:abnormal spindle-like microcephaly-associated protein homolog isoform X1 [Papaver somniferum]
MEEEKQPPSPLPNPKFSSSSTAFKDISNFKTPKKPNNQKPYFQSPFPHFFTASKQSPPPSSSSKSVIKRRPSIIPSTPSINVRRRTSICPSTRSKAAARRLKAFELEQSQSCRKAQSRKQKSLESLSKSLSVWLNFLFENPKSCGCDVSLLPGEGTDRGEQSRNGKRDSGVGTRVSTDGTWRSPKRLKDSSGRSSGDGLVLSSAMFNSLEVSLNDVCSLDDLKQRMREYLSLDCCKEVFSMISQVAKIIDERRLKMKAHCPMVTDVGMKQKAIKVLMNYNPTWLRIGLYIVFGGDSLLPVGDVNSNQELVFLKMVLEKQFFSHLGLAKTFAYNKLVEGLYRPGYFEALGNVILKRFLLLVLVLDKAKSLSSLPIKYGIDGTDGGSPLLFCRQSNIKSSRQVISEFLSTDVMHGEGNLLAHLVIVGYKVSYQQSSLLEYDFRITELFEDLQDGVRLCRAIQLLQHDASVLTKMVVPSDNRKKNLVNCGVALQYLKQAGVQLLDEDGVMIVAEDVATGEKELTLSLLWNMFIHLQLPLLINKMLLFEEVSKVKAANVDYSWCITSSQLDLLLEWIQSISGKYELKIDSFTSLIDGKALWCLIDYYFRNELLSACSREDSQNGSDELSVLWTGISTDAVHNFTLAQKLASMLGSFPEVLQISEVLENNGACNERSVIILLVFLSSQLIGRKNMELLHIHKLLGCSYQSPEMKRSSLDKCFMNVKPPENQNGLDDCSSEDSVRNFKVVQAWWRDLVKKNHCCNSRQNSPGTDIKSENAARLIQSHFKRFVERKNFLKIKAATSFLQTVFRAWLMVKSARHYNKSNAIFHYQLSSENHKHPIIFRRYLNFMVERNSFIRLKSSVLLIQRTARKWIRQRSAATKIQSHWRGWYMRREFLHLKKAVTKIQSGFRCLKAWRNYNQYISAATKIQSHWRGWSTRREFLHLKKAAIKIQSCLRCLKAWRNYKEYRLVSKSATIIQSHFRGFISRREAARERECIKVIQSYWKCFLMRKVFVYKREAVIKIQSSFRCTKLRKEFLRYKYAAIEIQRFARGHITRNRLPGSSCLGPVIDTGSTYQNSRSCQSLEKRILLYSVLKLQRWWKRVLLLKSRRTRSAVVVQSYVRGWLARREANRERNRVVVIQSYWKGYLARKEARGQLVDLRLRVQKSAANVDDGMRLINRLVAAVSELLSFRSVSSILHTCATLDVTTQHSQKCCETLVAAGAIKTLLKLISSVSRSIPDQEVLKHALSTLRNLASYPDLAQLLIDTNGSIELILSEMLRNKEEGFFIASQVLKMLCRIPKGVQTIRQLPALLKRLKSLVDDLKRRVATDKRNARSQPGKDYNERKLKEAMELLKLISK